MTNLSKQKREALEAKIELLRHRLDAADSEAQNALFALKTELKHKKYGLVWEEHEEEIGRTLSENLPVLTEQTELAVNAGGLTHFLLEGDNLAALEILKRTHKGKIDVIYIDPPYNTRNRDFMYNDAFVAVDDSFSHSKWLSFIGARLRIAKDLLSNKGSIFISISDKEFQQLRLLCDEIFGENNFIATFPKKGVGGRQDSTHFAVVHEYVLCYAKNNNLFEAGRQVNSSGNYNLVDENGRRYKTQLLRKWGDNARRVDRPNLFYPIYFNLSKNTTSMERLAVDDIEIFPMLDESREGRWRWSQETMATNIKAGKVTVLERNNSFVAYEKIYEDERNETKPYSTWLDDISNETGSTLLKDVIGENDFDYPKPMDLIIKILKRASSNKNATVLDFFAGSGTTGQAVLELNKEDGGNRQFILCTNNENDICRNITYERMKTVITGKRQDGSAYSDGIAATLKYDKINYVAVKEDGDILLYDDYADELLQHVREMVELENGISFETNSTIKICLHEDELDEFVDVLNEKSEVRAVYVGHDLLMTAQQKAKLAALNVAVNIIPQYYYEDEV